MRAAVRLALAGTLVAASLVGTPVFAEQPTNLHQVDWFNVTVPAEVCHTDAPVTLHDGQAVANSSGWPGFSQLKILPGAPRLDWIAYGDLYGNGEDVAVLDVYCGTLGPRGGSGLANSLVVYSGAGGVHPIGFVTTVTPPLAGCAPAYPGEFCPDSGVRVPAFADFNVTPHKLSATERYYARDDPYNFPTQSQTDTWSFDGKEFTLAGLAPGHTDLHQVDWKNVTVPAEVCHTDGPVTLQDGRAVATSSGWTGFPQVALLALDPPAYGDLYGNGQDVAVLQVTCDTGGLTGGSRLADNLVVYSGDGGISPIGFVTTVTPPVPLEPAAEFDPARETVGMVTPSKLSATERYYAPGDPNAAPSQFQSDTWSFDGNAFTLEQGSHACEPGPANIPEQREPGGPKPNPVCEPGTPGDVDQTCAPASTIPEYRSGEVPRADWQLVCYPLNSASAATDTPYPFDFVFGGHHFVIVSDDQAYDPDLDILVPRDYTFGYWQGHYVYKFDPLTGETIDAQNPSIGVDINTHEIVYARTIDHWAAIKGAIAGVTGCNHGMAGPMPATSRAEILALCAMGGAFVATCPDFRCGEQDVP